MSPKVTILILNWNGQKYLEQFLPSVMKTTYQNFHVLVADNGSTDNSVEFLQKNYPEVEIAVLDKNYGFTGGNNRALDYVNSPYYVLLNSDVEVTPGWLEPLVETMEKDQSIASVQPKIRSFHEKYKFEYAGASGGWMDSLGYPFCRGRIFDELEEDTGQYQDTTEVFWATGACCMIRKSVTDEIGLFEERLFAHMEEIDFCWRAKNKGYKIMVCPLSMVYHVGGGTLNKTNPKKTYLNIHNSLAVMIMNMPTVQLPFKFFVRLLLDGVFALKLLFAFEFKSIWAIIKAHWSLFFSFSYWWKKRKEIYLDHFPKRLPEKGVMKGSIVFKYFLLGKKKFSALKIK